MLERDYQSKLVRRLKREFVGCYVIKNDAQLKQGIPDLLVLFKDKWIALEVKNSKTAHHQPNQDFHVERMNEMSYACFIYPENEDEVIEKMKEVFG